MLIPHDGLERGVRRLRLRGHVDDVVAGVADEPGDAARPERGRGTRGHAAPVEAGQNDLGLFTVVVPGKERVRERHQVRPQRRLLPGAGGLWRPERRGPEAPQVRHDHAGAAGCEVGDCGVEEAGRVGEAVR